MMKNKNHYNNKMKKILKKIKCSVKHRPILSGNYEVINWGILNGTIKCTICGCEHRATIGTGPH